MLCSKNEREKLNIGLNWKFSKRNQEVSHCCLVVLCHRVMSSCCLIVLSHRVICHCVITLSLCHCHHTLCHYVITLSLCHCHHTLCHVITHYVIMSSHIMSCHHTSLCHHTCHYVITHVIMSSHCHYVITRHYVITHYVMSSHVMSSHMSLCHHNYIIVSSHLLTTVMCILSACSNLQNQSFWLKPFILPFNYGNSLPYRYLAMPARWIITGRSHRLLSPYWRSFKVSFLGCWSTFVPTLEKTSIMKKISFLTQKGGYLLSY